MESSCKGLVKVRVGKVTQIVIAAKEIRGVNIVKRACPSPLVLPFDIIRPCTQAG